MSRTLPTPLADIFNRTKKVEGAIVVGIEWTPGLENLYADRKLNGLDQPLPIVQDVSGFNTSQVVTGAGDNSNIKIILADITGEIKTITEENDIQKATAKVYVTAQGAPLSARTLVFQGQIETPVTWGDADRTVQLDIISNIEDVEVGFSIEDGDFPFVPEDAKGKAWPLAFGEVCWEQTTKIRSTRKGILDTATGVIDFTIAERLCQARNLTCSQKYDPPRTDGTPGESTDDTNGCMFFRDNKTGDKGCICPDLPFGQCPTPETEDDRIDKDCLTRRWNEICKLIVRQKQELDSVVNPLTIRGGENFPQNSRIQINIGGALFTGTMVGTTFTYDEVIHPQREDFRNPPCRKFVETTFGWRNSPGQTGWNRQEGSSGRTFEFSGSPLNQSDCEGGGELQREVVNGAGESWRYYETFEAADFLWLPAGSEVFLVGEDEILYIASLIPGVVTGVAAYRKYNDTTLLVNLPTSYYTVRTTNYVGYNVVEIVVPKPLNTFRDEAWETEIFIKFVSTVGPNPADIIKWLIEKYTSLVMDTASFVSVKAKLTNYPSNHYLTDRPNVLALVRDIAYQARCAAIIREGKLVLIYLSEKPTALRTLNESDIVEQSFTTSLTETEELHTRHEIKWQKFDAGNNKEDEIENLLRLKFNVPRYKQQDVDYDYFTQNTFETIQKSATFWLIRESCTWRRIRFSTTLKHIDLDVFDAVSINLPDLFPAQTTIIIEETNLNIEENTIAFVCWTPIRAGESSEYIWAWPAQQDAKEKFPLQGIDDGREGDGFDFIVTPPLNHLLRGGFIPDDAGLIQTTGDRSPSDLDDVFPAVNCPDANNTDDVISLEPPVFEDFKDLSSKQDEQFENNQDSFGGGGGGSGDDQESKGACGMPNASGFCTYEATTTFINPKSVTSVQTAGTSCPGGGPCKCENPGRPCTGGTTSMCHTFGARWAATQFIAAKQAEAKLNFDQCLYECGKSKLWSAGGFKAIAGEGGFGECELSGAGDPNAAGAGDGEINKPVPT